MVLPSQQHPFSPPNQQDFQQALPGSQSSIRNTMSNDVFSSSSTEFSGQSNVQHKQDVVQRIQGEPQQNQQQMKQEGSFISQGQQNLHPNLPSALQILPQPPLQQPWQSSLQPPMQPPLQPQPQFQIPPSQNTSLSHSQPQSHPQSQLQSQSQSQAEVQISTPVQAPIQTQPYSQLTPSSQQQNQSQSQSQNHTIPQPHLQQQIQPQPQFQLQQAMPPQPYISNHPGPAFPFQQNAYYHFHAAPPPPHMPYEFSAAPHYMGFSHQAHAPSAISLNAAAQFPSMLGTIQPSEDAVGQIPPAGGIKPRVTTSLWEDEGTLCFQVEVKGICVARREDNNMINGTKLLNVAGMTRGRRDGILKSEKIRHVVKIGTMYLKGVWIPYERALEFSTRERIVDILYPLFVADIKTFIYHPTNLTRTVQVLAAAERKKQIDQFRIQQQQAAAMSAASNAHHQNSQNQMHPQVQQSHLLPALSSNPQLSQVAENSHTNPTDQSSRQMGPIEMKHMAQQHPQQSPMWIPIHGNYYANPQTNVLPSISYAVPSGTTQQHSVHVDATAVTSRPIPQSYMYATTSQNSEQPHVYQSQPPQIVLADNTNSNNNGVASSKVQNLANDSSSQTGTGTVPVPPIDSAIIHQQNILSQNTVQPPMHSALPPSTSSPLNSRNATIPHTLPALPQ
ncbi:uncharacterized protein SAPINGB_P000866 [Magnusiomyces paraingens]|uniref:HTH APSES-type domain-containing protein n=1 Tax=Magnusiomyces paraingens TaxID=2606893 RepID=A0A5E8B8Z3_9ASCO|nr:uncharacterized protein SAPINGB_P000866 [Saprochaete ingens]VVT45738.1 unnamed protein product [Saprochaete ingens]